MAAIRSGTGVKVPRRMACRVMIEKKTSTRLSQEPDVGGEVQRHPLVLREPGLDGRVLVGGVVVDVVDHDVRLPAGVGLRDLLEEPQELLVPVPVVAANSRVDQCVTPSRSGGGSNVVATTSASSTVRGRPGFGRSSRVLSLSRCQRSSRRYTPGTR
jgi:hypothetical protein